MPCPYIPAGHGNRRAATGRQAPNACGPGMAVIASARPFTAETAQGAEKNLFFKTQDLLCSAFSALSAARGPRERPVYELARAHPGND